MRFDRTPDGAIWTQVAFAYSFWQRYLAVFDSVRILARIQYVEVAQSDWLRADGIRVTFSPLPYYVGPRQYLLKVRQMRQAMRSALQGDEAVLLRIPSPIAATAVPILKQQNRPYGVEVVGDPYDVFAPGSVRHPLRPLFRWWFPRQLRLMCAGARAASYVTEHTLQRRYPPAPDAFSTHYSSIELPEEAFVPTPRQYDNPPNQFTLVTVSTLAQMYKGVDVLLNAISICAKGGLHVRLIIVGDGKHRSELEAQTQALGLTEQVQFCGQLPAGSAVREQLDMADCFVLPSYQEGLPRAMIEAMARGLPCIGSTVGGIPELLPARDLVPPNDVHALAEKIREVLTNPDRMTSMSARNLHKAREYADDMLRERRTAFYQHLKSETEAWLKTRG